MPSPAPAMQIWPAHDVSQLPVAVFHFGYPMSRYGSPGKLASTVVAELPTPVVPYSLTFMYTKPRMRKLPPRSAEFHDSAPDSAAVFTAPVRFCGFVALSRTSKK